MDERFHIIYQQLISVYRLAFEKVAGEEVPAAKPAASSLEHTVAVLQRVLTEEKVLGGRELRPDAALYLMVNLHQMVVLPLSHPEAPPPPENLEEELREDVRNILAASADAAGDRRDVAASHVVRGTAAVLDKLNLKSWRLWERNA
jgi:hypothetical protein